MPNLALPASDVLRWSEETSDHWQKLFQVYPEALEFDCDIYGVHSVRGFGLHRQAAQRFHDLLKEQNVDWSEQLEFMTVSAGKKSATRERIFFHALLHGIRHYGQLATLVRQHGVKPDWSMDFLFSGQSDPI